MVSSFVITPPTLCYVPGASPYRLSSLTAYRSSTKTTTSSPSARRRFRLRRSSLCPSLPLRCSFFSVSSSRPSSSSRGRRPTIPGRRSTVPTACTSTPAGSTGASTTAPFETRPYVPDTVTFTSLDNNSFLLRYNDTRIAIDPWLTGELMFNDNPKFFIMHNASADRLQQFDVSSVTHIVLTQGLPDHTHRPSLALFDRSLPVIAPPSSKPVLSALGFTNVTYADFDQVVPLTQSVSLKCLRGSLFGPPWAWRQNALLFKFDGRNGLYHEPHGDHHWPTIEAEKDNIETVIVPVTVTKLKLPLGFKIPIVNGIPSAMRLCEAINPTTVIGFDNSRGESSGLLSDLFEGSGGIQTMVDDFEMYNRKTVDDRRKVKNVIAHAELLIQVAVTGETGVGDIIDD